MRDLIDRQAAIEELKSYIVDPDTAISENPDDVFQYNAGIRTAVGVIMELQTASPWHRVEEPPKEEGMYIVAVFFSGHWIFDAAWFTHDITEIYCVPCEKKISGFYRGNHEVHPDYWMPIEPPKEDA